MTTARGTSTTHEPERSLRTQGRRAAEARATVPDAHLTRTVQAPRGEAGAAIIGALARTLRAMPEANASHRDAEIERHERVNVGIVVPDGHGTALVTILDADTKETRAIASELSELTAQVAGGTLTAPRSAGATCSVIDLTGTGAEEHVPVLIPPHAVALSVGDRHDDGRTTLTLAWDLRVLSPFAAAAVLEGVAHRVHD